MKQTPNLRFDQVAELTRGIDLPLAPIGDDLMAIILEAIAATWTSLKQQGSEAFNTGQEAEISSLLITRLNASLSGDPVLAQIVSAVDRGSETVNYNGTKLEGRPDILFALTKQDKRFRLMGECKIIDIPKKKTPRLYRKHGIKRFINGDYAWGSCEGIMLGYVRCTARLDPHLLSRLHRDASLNYTAHSMELSAKPPMELGTSTHDRKFPYIHTTSKVPGQIKLWHLWLPTVNEASETTES